MVKRDRLGCDSIPEDPSGQESSRASWVSGGAAGQGRVHSRVMKRVSRAPNTASSAAKTQLGFGHKTSGIFLISAYASFLAWLFHSYAVRSLVQSIGHLFHRFLLKG